MSISLYSLTSVCLSLSFFPLSKCNKLHFHTPNCGYCLIIALPQQTECMVFPFRCMIAKTCYVHRTRSNHLQSNKWYPVGTLSLPNVSTDILCYFLWINNVTRVVESLISMRFMANSRVKEKTNHVPNNMIGIDPLVKEKISICGIPRIILCFFKYHINPRADDVVPKDHAMIFTNLSR